MFSRRARGVTIIELIIFMMIMGVAMAMLIPLIMAKVFIFKVPSGHSRREWYGQNKADTTDHNSQYLSRNHLLI